MRRNHFPAFTLAELLIALAILGVLATFTIPKVLQTQGLQRRYALAQELLATLSQVTYQYAQENGGCFPGNLTCNFNTSTGAALDGLPTSSDANTNPDAYNRFTAYLDTHLNYIKTDTPGGRRDYVIGGSTVQPLSIATRRLSPGRYELSVYYYVYLEEDLIDGDGEYSSVGVDSKYVDMIVSAKGTTIGGMNNWNARLGFAYDPYVSSVFDYKEHPGDTCSLYGFDCGE